MSCRTDKKLFYLGYTFVHRGERWWDIYRYGVLFASRDTLDECKRYAEYGYEVAHTSHQTWL